MIFSMRRLICIFLVLASFQVNATPPVQRGAWSTLGGAAVLVGGASAAALAFYQGWLESQRPDIKGSYGFVPLEFYRSLKDLPGYFKEKEEKYGYPYYALFLGMPIVVIGGDGIYREWFQDGEANNLGPGWPFHFEMLLGKNLIFDEGQRHLFHRRLIRGTMTDGSLADQMSFIDGIIKEGFASAAGNSSVAVSQDIAMRAFFKVAGFETNPEYLKEMQRLFKTWASGLNLLPMFQAMRARRQILDKIEEKEYNKNSLQEGTILYRLKKYLDDPAQYNIDEDNDLAENRKKEGFVLSKEELKNDLLLLQFAGQDTTANMISSIVCFLSIPENKGVLEKVREIIKIEFEGELPKTLGKEAYRKIKSIPYLRAVKYEALRLASPFNGVIRKAGEDCYLPSTDPTKPKVKLRPGTLVKMDLNSNHRNGYLFADPQKFNPERWLDAEGKINEEWVKKRLDTFGGGEHACVGRLLAEIEMLIAILRFAEREDLEVVPESIQEVTFPIRHFWGTFSK